MDELQLYELIRTKPRRIELDFHQKQVLNLIPNSSTSQNVGIDIYIQTIS